MYFLIFCLYSHLCQFSLLVLSYAFDFPVFCTTWQYLYFYYFFVILILFVIFLLLFFSIRFLFYYFFYFLNNFYFFISFCSSCFLLVRSLSIYMFLLLSLFLVFITSYFTFQDSISTTILFCFSFLIGYSFCYFCWQSQFFCYQPYHMLYSYYMLIIFLDLFACYYDTGLFTFAFFSTFFSSCNSTFSS